VRHLDVRYMCFTRAVRCVFVMYGVARAVRSLWTCVIRCCQVGWHLARLFRASFQVLRKVRPRLLCCALHCFIPLCPSHARFPPPPRYPRAPALPSLRPLYRTGIPRGVSSNFISSRLCCPASLGTQARPQCTLLGGATPDPCCVSGTAF
jgi:hypothetical protein